MSSFLFQLNPPGPLAAKLATALDLIDGDVVRRRFPDGESYLRVEADVRDHQALVLAHLSPPDSALMPLLLLTETLRDLGASRVGLISPYLPYLRQDTRFQRGEAVSSTTFAGLICERFDWLITVDPHLHRYRSLNQIYTIPSINCPSAPLVIEWIGKNVARPLLIGPDQESEQWVAAVAESIPAPHVILRKQRRGDNLVEVSVPEVAQWRDHTPVLLDDIVSTGRTMIETMGHLGRAGLKPAVCVGTHAVFAGDAFDALQKAGPERIITTNSLPHPSNGIDLSDLIADAVREHGLLE